MADIHDLFVEFNDNISLSTEKSANLRRGRDALRSKIKTWFDENGKKKPSFCWQGSFAMKTTVNPINGNEYDLDDGVYLSGYADTDQDDWPTPQPFIRGLSLPLVAIPLKPQLIKTLVSG